LPIFRRSLKSCLCWVSISGKVLSKCGSNSSVLGSLTVLGSVLCRCRLSKGSLGFVLGLGESGLRLVLGLSECSLGFVLVSRLSLSVRSPSSLIGVVPVHDVILVMSIHPGVGLFQLVRKLVLPILGSGFKTSWVVRVDLSHGSRGRNVLWISKSGSSSDVFGIGILGSVLGRRFSLSINSLSCLSTRVVNVSEVVLVMVVLSDEGLLQLMGNLILPVLRRSLKSSLSWVSISREILSKRLLGSILWRFTVLGYVLGVCGFSLSVNSLGSLSAGVVDISEVIFIMVVLSDEWLLKLVRHLILPVFRGSLESCLSRVGISGKVLSK